MLLAPVIPAPDRETDKKEAVLVLPAFMEGSRQARPGELPGDNFKRALDHYAGGIDSLFGAGGQVIVFNDGSTDNTAEIARSFGVEVLTHEDGMNHGRGRSLSAAFKQLDGRAAMVGYTDADGSYNWDAQKALMAEIDAGAHFANAFRLRGGDQHDGLTRRIGHSVINRVCNSFAPTGVSDPQAGAKWMDGTVASELWAGAPDRWAADRWALHQAKLRGLKVVEVGFPIDMAEESTVRPVRDGLEMIRDSLSIYESEQAEAEHRMRAVVAHGAVNGLNRLVRLAAR